MFNRRVYQLKYRNAHLESTRERDRKYAKKRYRTNPEWAILRGAKRRAKDRGIVFSLQLSDIVIPLKCPLLDIKLTRGKGKLHDQSPTLDRKNHKRGYVPKNVWVISAKANRMKNNSTFKEMEKLVKNWRKFA
jgi:hypothetical protein